MDGVFDENIHPCKGCEDFEPPDGCKSKGGCGQEKEIGYAECALAMMRMWIDNVVTDGEYYKIMDKLNKHWGKEITIKS